MGTLETSPRLFARMTGALYLFYFAAAVPLAQRAAMIVPDNPVATAARIMAGEHLYRLTLISDLVGFAAYLAVTAMLYLLLKPVNRPVAFIAMLMSLAGCLIGAINTANAIVPLLLLHGGPAFAAFRPDQLSALAFVSLRLFTQVYNISLVFFAGFLVLAGYLIFASRFLPRLLGVLLVIAGLGWFVWVSAGFSAIPLDVMVSRAIMAAGILAELGLALWLLLFGVNASAWQQRAGIVGKPSS